MTQNCITFKIFKIMRTYKQKMNDYRFLNVTKFICILTLILYVFFNEAMMNTFGVIFPIVASIFLLIRRRWINKLLEEDI